MKHQIIILLITLIFIKLEAQNNIGQWKEYLSFNKVNNLTSADNKIYASCDIGIIIYDTQENILTTKTKLNGLSSNNISVIKTLNNNTGIIIGYNDGNIDVFTDKIYNIPDIKLKTMSVDKTINQIYVIDNTAYCATNFGIVAVNYAKQEIKDTYYIGENSTQIKVYSVTATTDSIYAATEKGIMAAPVNSNKLSFYETWENITFFDNYVNLCTVDNKIIAATKEGKIDYLNNGSFINIGTYKNYVKIIESKDGFNVVCSDKIFIFNNKLENISQISDINIEEKSYIPNFSSILKYNDNIWIGDKNMGLIKVDESFSKIYTPDGPASNMCHKLVVNNNRIYSVAGYQHQISPKFILPEFSLYNNGKWINYTRQSESEFKDVYNLCDIAIDPKNPNHYFISSAHGGIFEFDDDKVINHYTNENSSIKLAYIWNIVNAIYFDEDGNLFGANMANNNMIILKSINKNPDAQFDYWYSYNYLKNMDVDVPWIWQITQDNNKLFWCVSRHLPKGLFIFDTNNTLENPLDDRFMCKVTNDSPQGSKLLFWDNEGQVIDKNPTYVAKDKNGYMWIATSSGLLVYYQTGNIFDVQRPVFSRIKVAREDDSGYADYLLEDIAINHIKVDNADRKWISTENNGVYLISSDGNKIIHHFTVKNSPLLSNTVYCIDINENTGEVFIATSSGIISYKGTSSAYRNNYNNVKVYPNPVRPEYNGNIIIRGLKDNSTVRITDLSGNLVYGALSLGGQINWNGRDLNNKKVSSGVYLVFATNTDGEESMVTKIMIIK